MKSCDLLSDGAQLLIRSPDEMTHEIVSRRKTLDAVTDTLATLDRPMTVSAELSVGGTPAPAAPAGDGAPSGASDGFDELLSFAADNPDFADIR